MEKLFLLARMVKLIETKDNLKDLPYIFGNLDMNNFLSLKRIIDNSTLEFKEIKKFIFFSFWTMGCRIIIRYFN